MDKKLSHMAEYTLLLLIVIEVISTVNGAGFLGCYEDDPRNRFFAMNPGNYDYELMSPLACQQACASWTSDYVGLVGGRFCFCSDLPPSLPWALVAACDEPCSDPASSDMCGGGMNYVSVYKAPLNTEGFWFSPTSSAPVVVGADATFDVKLYAGSDSMNYAADYGGGKSDYNATNMFTKKYVMAGTHLATGYAVDADALTPEVKFSSQVTVVHGVLDVTLECPDVEATYEEVECNASVTVGSGMNAVFDRKDGTAETFDLPDSMWFAAGSQPPEHASPDVPSVVGTVNKMYVLPRAVFEDSGKVMGFEFHAETAGNIDIFGLTPTCADYCFESNSCDPACTNGVDACSAGGTTAYCGAKQECVNPASLSTCSGNPTFGVHDDYTVTWKKSVVAVLGYNYLAIDPTVDILEVGAGDTLGYFSAVGILSTRTEAVNDDRLYSAVSTSPSSGNTIAAPFAGTGSTVMLRAVATKPLQLRLFYIYTTPGIYNVEFTVDSTDVPGAVTANYTVTIQYGINHAIIETAEYGKTGVAHDFTLLNHTGSAITYNWGWDDGETNVTTEVDITHAFPTRGTYNVTILSENALSSKENSTIVIIEDEIVGLDVNSEYAPTFIPHPFLLTMVSGSDYLCDWDMGDGDTFTTTEFETPITGVDRLHTYQIESSSIPVEVTCYNNVSSDTFSFTQASQYPVWNLRLESLGAREGMPFAIAYRVDYGTDATYIMWFDGEIIAQTYDHSLLRGATATLSALPLGPHNVTIRGTNLVSDVILMSNFTIEAPVRGAMSSAYIEFGDKEPVIKTLEGEDVTFNVTIESGTSIMVIWDFDGACPQETYDIGQTNAWPSDPGFEYRTCNFTSPGVYHVEVIVKNEFDTYTFNHKIIVYNNVADLELVCDPCPFMGLKCDAELYFIAHVDPPTLADIDFDYGDTQTETGVAFDVGPHVYPHTYNRRGSYFIQANVSNAISSGAFNCTLLVVEPVCNMRLQVLPPHAVVGGSVDVHVYMEKGTMVNITWDFELDGVDVNENRTATTAYESDVATWTYSTLGTYTIEVVSISPLGTTTEHYQIKVEHPVIDEFIFTSSAPQVFPINPGYGDIVFNIQFPPGLQLPTDASMYVVFGDKSESTPILLPTSITSPGGFNLSHTYTTDGDFTATLVVYNLASRMEVNVSAGIYIPIIGLSTEPLQIPSDVPNGQPEVGKGPLQDQFSVNSPVLFKMDKVQGTIVKYMVVAVHADGTAIQMCNSSINPVENLFAVPGDYLVNITAYNPISSDSVEIEISVLSSVKGLGVDDGNTVTKKKEPKVIHISFDEVSEDTCVFVDFNDGRNSVFLYSNGTTCTEYPGYPIAGPVYNPMSASYTPKTNGFYSVNVSAGNFLNTEEEILTFMVTNANCKRPKLKIRNQHNDITDANVKAKRDGFTVEGSAELDCQVTLVNSKSWKVTKLNDATGDPETEIDVSSLPSSQKSVFLVPSWFLDIGLYELKYEVFMDVTQFKDEDIFMDSLIHYVNVIHSPLIAALVSGGSDTVSRGWGQTIELEPLRLSMDTDFPENAYDGQVLTDISAKFDTMTLYCKQIDEEFPRTADGMLNPANPQAPLTTSQLAALVLDHGGCFRQGPGPVVINTGSLEFNTKNMHENETYEFFLEITKDSRKAAVSLNLEVLPGSPPALEIGCKSPCTITSQGLSANPTSRLAMSGKCIHYCNGDVNYQWSLFRKGLESSWIEIEKFKDYVTGINSQNISISKTMFEYGYGLYASLSRYRLRLAAWRKGEREGVAYTMIELNYPPMGGSCEVYPTVGVTRNTVFTMNCSGWTDDKGIDSYIFYAQDRDYPDQKQLGMTRTSMLQKALQQGSPRQNYEMDILARITDQDGAATEVFVGTVQVNPLPTSEAKSIVDDILKNPQNELSMISNVPDVSSATETFSQIAGILNSISTSAQTGANGLPLARTYLATPYGADAEYDDTDFNNPVYEQERNEYGALRTTMLMGLTNVTLTSVDDLMSVVSTANVITERVDQINREAQIQGVKVLTDAMDLLLGRADDTPLEDFIRGVACMITLGGQIQEAATLSIDEGSIQDHHDTKSTDFHYYDTDYNSKDPWLIYIQDEASRKVTHLENANSKHQKHSNNFIIGETEQIKKTISEAVLRFMVAGEPDVQIKTPKTAMTIRKTTAGKIFNKTLTEGRAYVTFPIFCSLVPLMPNCSDAMQVGVISHGTPMNQFRHIENAHNVPTLSSTLSLDVYDSNGRIIDIKNTLLPIELTIPHDRKMKDPEYSNVTAEIPDKENAHFFYHSFNVTKECTALQIELVPGSPDDQLLVIAQKGEFPNPNTSDTNYGMWHVGMTPSSMQQSQSGEGRPYVVFISQEKVNCYQGLIVIGIRQLAESEKDKFNNPDQKVKLPFEDRGQIKRPYKLRVIESACYYKKDRNSWETKGCTVDRRSDIKATYCSCNHLTTFGGGFAVAPNKIDWDFVFSNADFFSNPTLYITEIVIAILYIVVAIWARRHDHKMAFKLGSTPLPDNSPEDKYLYEILVKTGSKKSSGTDSQVSFIMSGEADETDVRLFADNKRKIFRRNATDSFLMAVPRPLGPIQYVRLWHDNMGKGKYQGWYCNYMIISDLQTREKFIFLVNKWFAVEEDDGQVDRLIPIAGPEQMVEFGNLFQQKTRKNMSDDHLWFSVFARPPQSRFTCLQRVSCCLLLLFTSMLANAMFYERTEDDPGSNILEFGPFALSPQQLYVGFIVNLVVFPINFIVVFLFRRSRPKNKRPSRLSAALQAHAKATGSSIQSSSNDMKQLIGDQDRMSPSPSTSSGGGSPMPAYGAPKRPDTGLAQQTMAIPMQNPNAPYRSSPVRSEKKPFALPWWFKILGWLLLWGGVLASAAFVTFYGIMFGDIKCKKWISSLFVTFITSIFLTQPIKVFLAALLFSLIFKKADMSEGDEEEDEEQIILRPDEQWLHSMPNDPEYNYITKERKIHYKPPDPEALERARNTRIKELKMFDILREIVLYSCFLWILLVISYGFRDPNSFFMKQNMDRMFLDKGLMKPSNVSNNFMEMYTFDQFWDWLEKTAVPNLRAGYWYNGEPPIGQRGFVGDRVSRIMGYATLRQLRIHPKECEVLKTFKPLIPECNIPYDISSEADENFDIGWEPLPSGQDSLNDSYPEYTYRNSSDLDGYPFWGSQAVYSGGGYVLELKGSEKVLLDKIAKLKKNMWLDRYTRAIFMEFTVYNPFVNLFGIVTLCAEVVVSGGMAKYKRIETMNLLGYYQEGFGFQIFCEIIYVVFILFFIIKELRNVYKQGKKYFGQFWNWNELFIIILSIAAVVIYFYRYIIASSLVEEFHQSHGNAYMKFQYVGYWNEMLIYLAGTLVFLASIKFIKLLRFNKRMGMLAATLRLGAKPLMLFGVMFFIMFMAFAQFFYLIYFVELSNFRSLIHSMETCQQMLVGKFNFNAMQGSNPVLGPLVFFCYVVTVYYILINMFLTILNESFATVRADISLQSDEYEMVSFIMKRFKQWTGLQTILGKSKSKSKAEEFAKFAEYEQQVEKFPERMDRLMGIISRAYFMADTLDAIFDPSRPQEGKKAMKAMMKQAEEQQATRKKKGGMMISSMQSSSSSSSYSGSKGPGNNTDVEETHLDMM